MKSIIVSWGIAVLATIAVCPCATAAESVQFNYHLPQVGQQADYEVHFDLDLNITLRQDGKIGSSQNQQISRSLQRHVRVLQVAGDRAVKVQVQYDQAQEMVSQGEQHGEPRALPIEGKTYQVERKGPELLITDVDGKPVPDDQRGLVTANMDSVGHSNQLGRFLHGKTVSVGESLELPKEMAADLLGMHEARGDAQKVELTLHSIQQEPDRKVAEFAALIIVKMGSGSMLEMKGNLQLDVETCHITSADFSGPVSSQEQQVSAGDKLDVMTEGTLKAAVRSRDLK